MKIVVTAKGTDLDSAIDPHFGRGAYLLVIDTETLELEAIDNSENVKAFKGAGISAATIIFEKGAKVLLTGFCGPNAFKTCTAAGIEVINDINGTVREVVAAYKEGKYTVSEAPNTEGHV